MSSISIIATLSLSIILCFLSFGTYLWTSSNVLLAAFVASSCTALFTYVLSFLVMAYQKKTGNDEFNMCCCNVFNVAMLAIYVLFVSSFLTTICGIINSFVADPTIQYILFGVYGGVLLMVIIGSVTIVFARKAGRVVNDIL